MLEQKGAIDVQVEIMAFVHTKSCSNVDIVDERQYM